LIGIKSNFCKGIDQIALNWNLAARQLFMYERVLQGYFPSPRF